MGIMKINQTNTEGVGNDNDALTTILTRALIRRHVRRLDAIANGCDVRGELGGCRATRYNRRRRMAKLLGAIELVRAQVEEEYKSKIYCVNTLNQIGNNLNQLSRNVNTAHYNGDAANWCEIHEALIEIYMLFHLLLAEIRDSERTARKLQ